MKTSRCLYLRERFPAAEITPQFRLRISELGAARAVHYTADFMVSSCPVGQDPIHAVYWKHELYEIKDSRRRGHSDELTRPKMCRDHNPWISAVHLLTWDGQKWTERRIA